MHLLLGAKGIIGGLSSASTISCYKLGEIYCMKKTKTPLEERLLKTIWRLGGFCLVLGYVLRVLWSAFLDVNQFLRSMPPGEVLKHVYFGLYKITFITNNSEYVSYNWMAIYLAVILGIAFLALLILLGIYMNPREKEPVGSSEEKTEDASAS